MSESVNPILVAGATAIAGFVVAEVSRRVANAMVGDPAIMEAEKYDEMHRRLNEQNIRGPRTPVTPRPAVAHTSGRKLSVSKEKGSPVMNHVREAMNQLALAEKSTNCGVCRKGAAAARDAVKRESEIIVRADSKSQIIQELKTAGKLPKTARWDKLSPDQKSFINRVVEGSIQNGI